MAKTELTLQLEKEIWRATRKQGVFGCFEVTIGWFGRERVDYMTYDTKNIIRCYEIKVSVSDFHSSNCNTFVGHFNYYVMPHELYLRVQGEIPDGIGAFTAKGSCVSCEKRSKRRELSVNEAVIKDSLIRSLYREVDKQFKSDDEPCITELKRQINYERQEKSIAERRYRELEKEIRERLGNGWRLKIVEENGE